jgi:HemY protein
MRMALWFVALFAVAVAVALGLSQQVGTVTLFVPPYRVDLSLNLVLIGLALLFALLYVALRSLLGLWVLPEQARRWRVQQRERSAQSLMLNAQIGWMTGRYLRARKAALQGLGARGWLACSRRWRVANLHFASHAQRLAFVGCRECTCTAR